MLTPWHLSTQTLQFRLSYVTIARARFPVLACEVGIGKDQKDEDLNVPPDRMLDDELQGFVMRGLPVQTIRPTLEKRDGYIIYTPWHFERGFVELRQTFDEYQQQFSSKTRSTNRRKIRKLISSGSTEPDFRVYKTRADVVEFLAIARELSARTYQQRLLNAGIPQSQSWEEETLCAAERDCIRAFVLFFDNKPTSYLLLTGVDKTLSYDYLGYDPDYQRLSPGLALHWLALQYLMEEKRYWILDFTEGEGPQKKQFRTGHQICATIFCLRGSFRNRLIVRLHSWSERLSVSIGLAFSKLGIKDALKRRLRRSGNTTTVAKS